MENRLRKVFTIVMLSLSLVMGFTSISLAAESNMSGMDMSGQSASKSSATAPSTSVPNVPSSNTQHEATPGMDPNMPGMTSNTQNMDPNTPGMDPNMPGMQGQSQSQGEHDAGENEGVNWPMVGGFSVVNLLVIGMAGILKYSGKQI